jgi:hypothetical protein
VNDACYTINNEQISSKHTQRDLGILVSSDLTWYNHHKIICAQAYRLQYLIKMANDSTANPNTKKTLYLTLRGPTVHSRGVPD